MAYLSAILIAALTLSFGTVYAQYNTHIINSFDKYGFCCYTFQGNQLTIVGSLQSIHGINQTLATNILSANNYTLQDYNSSAIGVRISANIQ